MGPVRAEPQASQGPRVPVFRERLHAAPRTAAQGVIAGQVRDAVLEPEEGRVGPPAVAFARDRDGHGRGVARRGGEDDGAARTRRVCHFQGLIGSFLGGGLEPRETVSRSAPSVCIRAGEVRMAKLALAGVQEDTLVCLRHHAESRSMPRLRAHLGFSRPAMAAE